MHTGFRQLLIVATVVLFMSLVFVWAALSLYGSWHDEWSGYNASTRISDGVCNIAVIPVRGEILPYPGELEDGLVSTNSDDFRAMLRAAENDPDILGVLVPVDSYGGAGAAGESIATSMQETFLPVAVFIRESGTSAAYLAATGGDIVIASPFSDVGGIGVTMSYVENLRQNESEGLGFVSLASAPHKDYLNPNRPLSAEERDILERDLAVWHNHFVSTVAANRGLSIEEVEALADGSSMPGELALEAGLVDAVGDEWAAREWLASFLEMPVEEVVVCG